MPQAAQATVLETDAETRPGTDSAGRQEHCRHQRGGLRGQRRRRRRHRELSACLRTGRALRVPRARTNVRGKTFFTPEVMISQRPAEVADRAVPGHRIELRAGRRRARRMVWRCSPVRRCSSLIEIPCTKWSRRSSAHCSTLCTSFLLARRLSGSRWQRTEELRLARGSPFDRCQRDAIQALPAGRLRWAR